MVPWPPHPSCRYPLAVWLLIQFLMFTVGCKRTPENPQAVKIDSLLSGIRELNLEIAEKQGNELQEYYTLIEEDLTLFEQGFFEVSGDPDWAVILPSYHESIHTLSQCKTACTDLQKELSFMESQLTEFVNRLQSEKVSDSLFNEVYAQEAALLGELNARVKTSLVLVGMHLENYRNLYPAIEDFKRERLKEHEERQEPVHTR